MKLYRISFLLLVLFMLLVYAAGQGASQSFDARAIFRPSSDVAQKIRDCANTGCIASVMQKAGASRQAIAFTGLLNGEGYMNSFREMGKIDLAKYTYSSPTMYVDEGLLLINGMPQVVFVDDSKYYDNLDIRSDPLYPALVRKFPEIYPWSGVGFETVQQLKSGGQRFTFISQLKSCRGCDVGGYAHVAFDFNSSGDFLGTKLIRLSRVSQRKKSR